MAFSDVIGQQPVKDFLIQSVEKNRLSHALLFQAPEGAGGLPMALAFAQYVVCTNKQARDACGHCGACKRAAQYIHPDIHFSYPVVPRKPGDKPISTDYAKEWREFLIKEPYGNTFDWLQFIGAENKQGNITAAECGDIIRKFNLKSYESEYKILLMWRPEFLEKEGNRLLKLIEEPPPKTLFIFVAENIERILPTIRSRAQLVKMNSLSVPEVASALVSRAGQPEEKAQQVATLAEGSYSEALKLIGDVSEDFLAELREWLNVIIQRNPIGLQEWIEQMASPKRGRERQKQFLRYFLSLVEHALRWQYLGREHLPFPDDEQEFAAKLDKVADIHQLRRIVEELDKACYYIERNANARLLFHALSLRLQYIFLRKDLPVEL